MMITLVVVASIETFIKFFNPEYKLQVSNTNIDIQKIDGSKLNTFGIIIAFFLVEDKEKRSCFLEETFIGQH